MSENAQPSGGGSAPSGQPHITVNLPPIQSGEDYRQMTPDQFKARLSEESEAGARRMLKQLGVPREQRGTVLDQIRAGQLTLSGKPKEGEPDYRSEYEKLKPVAERTSQLETELKEAHEILKAQFNASFEKLPEPVQKYLAENTPDDWRARQKALAALEKSGLLAALTTGTKPDPTVPVPPKPATTIAPAGPGAAAPSGALTPQQQYDALMAAGKTHAAAMFYAQHRTNVVPKKRS